MPSLNEFLSGNSDSFPHRQLHTALTLSLLSASFLLPSTGLAKPNLSLTQLPNLICASHNIFLPYQCLARPHVPYLSPAQPADSIPNCSTPWVSSSNWDTQGPLGTTMSGLTPPPIPLPLQEPNVDKPSWGHLGRGTESGK